MMAEYIDAGDRWVAVLSSKDNWRTERHEHVKQLPSLKARIAIQLAERFGAIAAKPSGEDAAGRQKIELMDPEEVVERSILIADALVDQIEGKGWMHDMPHPTEIYDQPDTD